MPDVFSDEPKGPEINASKIDELMGGENFLGVFILIYEKGGDGPEGIVCHSFSHGEENIPNLPKKLRVFADLWEEEHKQADSKP